MFFNFLLAFFHTNTPPMDASCLSPEIWYLIFQAVCLDSNCLSDSFDNHELIFLAALSKRHQKCMCSVKIIWTSRCTAIIPINHVS